MKSLKDLRFPKLEKKELRMITGGCTWCPGYGEGMCHPHDASDWCQGSQPG